MPKWLVSGLSLRASYGARECSCKAVASAQSSPPCWGKPPLAAVMMSIAVDQSSLLAAVEDLVQQLCTRWLLAQNGNGPRRATNA